MTESLVRVPRWIIAKAYNRGGLRLPKRILLGPEKKKDSVGFCILPGGKDKSFVNEKHINNAHTIVLSDKKLEFENWEYRFWAVELLNLEPQCAECRCCGQVFGVKIPRRKHGSDKGCFNKLTDAYGLLLKDMKCVVCDKYTTHQSWGVPICDTIACMDTWMHQEAQSNALLQALSLASQGEVKEEEENPSMWTGMI